MSKSQNLTQLIQRFQGKLPPLVAGDCISLVTHGELTIAFENLCVELYEFDIDLSEEDLDEILAIGEQLGENKSTWSFLINLKIDHIKPK